MLMELILGLIGICVIVCVIGFVLRLVIGLFGMILMGAAMVGGAIFLLMLIGEFFKFIFVDVAPILSIPPLF